MIGKRTETFNKANRKLRKVTRIVPWRELWEHNAVGRALLSVLLLQEDQEDNDADKQNGNNSEVMMMIPEALTTIRMWKTRKNALEGLPHAVESTADLVAVWYQDLLLEQQRQQGQQQPFVSSYSIMTIGLQLGYAAAVTRCVNGLADVLQQTRNMASSVAYLCSQLGIPSWIVDVRHESSHNALPTLPVLRMAAKTLLEFWKAEYWMPMMHDEESTSSSGGGIVTILRHVATQHRVGHATSSATRSDPIELLLEYEKCAASWIISGAENDGATGADLKSSKSDTDKRTSKRKQGNSETTIFLPYDPLFGEVGRVDDANNFDKSLPANDSHEGDESDDDWEDPTMGRVWGSSVGTNSNRFALLEPPKKKAKKEEAKKDAKKPKTKTKPNILKTKTSKDEKSPTDYATLFTNSTSPPEGYSIALRFLVWGGINEVPLGRGVLIPNCDEAFPSNEEGILKCLARYAPLIHGICRSWPGFATALLVHLTDFVLTIEMEGTETQVPITVADAAFNLERARRLVFLSAWIRFLLSQHFVTSLGSKLSSQDGSSITSTKLPLATLYELQDLGYPLNALKERCSEQQSEIFGVRGGEGEYHGKCGDILQFLNEILPSKEKVDQGSIINDEGTPTVKMSLDDMEELLSDVPKNVDDEENPPSTKARPSWVRCESWDPCAIGTLPGYPA